MSASQINICTVLPPCLCRLAEYFFYRPSFAVSPSDYSRCNTYCFSPLGYGPSNPLMGYVSYILSISGLFLRRRPSTVIRFVVAIVIDSINGVSDSWRMSHVGKEMLERIPPFANVNSSAWIPFIIFMGFLGSASIVHGFPCSMGMSITHAVSSGSLANSGSTSETSARFRFATQDIIFADIFFNPADAFESTPILWSIGSIGYDGPHARHSIKENQRDLL